MQLIIQINYIKINNTKLVLVLKLKLWNDICFVVVVSVNKLIKLEINNISKNSILYYLYYNSNRNLLMVVSEIFNCTLTYNSIYVQSY